MRVSISSDSPNTLRERNSLKKLRSKITLEQFDPSLPAGLGVGLI